MCVRMRVMNKIKVQEQGKGLSPAIPGFACHIITGDLKGINGAILRAGEDGGEEAEARTHTYKGD